ncbi:uncharacterized protein LOC128244600 [Mya arenaria]|uniref:uncharacterized protein LOC128243059 n=1 Tax=Mya arenaria TaxID=6604 RepID=UPI0022E7C2F8|nr:uncharacterized protein LOC128243059 [Mya arenaria]XP_052818565.1 uncharacterized protein LOC128244600 [Mya arenaria]
MPTSGCTDITSVGISDGSFVVFDWDNTLKLYNKETKSISSRVDRDVLLAWKRGRGCRMYIISAISPSRLNLETLLMEVERLGLRDVFVEPGEGIVLVPGRYARKGGVVVCGYDKAETFLEISGFGGVEFTQDDDEHADGISASTAKVADNVALETSKNRVSVPAVFFFDDEEVNVNNFSSIVPGSMCYLVK